MKARYILIPLALGAMTGAAAGLAIVTRLLARRRFSFKDKVVLITGGSRGLGLVLAHQLSNEGAKPAILARDPEELHRAETEFVAKGRAILAFPCDIRDRREAEAAIERVVREYGRIDVLINNAGVIQAGPFEHMQVEDFEEALAVHLKGPLYLTKAAFPYMRLQGGGRIVNIASIGGKVALPHFLPYTASKFALVGFSAGLRVELAKNNIIVTTVCPGIMRTGSHVNAQFKGRHQEEFTWFSLSAAIPGFSISARRAARQIIAACRRGDAELMITPQARMLPIVNSLCPGLTAGTMQLANRLLPGPAPEGGDELRKGWESQSRWSPSPLTTLIDRASERNNEVRTGTIVASP